MKMFYKKGRSSIVLMLVLTMLLQIVGPVVGDFVYAVGIEEGFKVTQESPIEDGKVTIDWEFTLDPNNSKDSYEYNSNFTLKEEKEPQALIGEDENGNEVEIGRYRISENGKITVDIHEELYEVFEEVVGPEIEETLPLTPLVPAEPVEQEETKTDSEDNSNQVPQEGTEEETTTETETNEEEIKEENNEKSTVSEEPNQIMGRTVRMVASTSDIDGLISSNEVNKEVKTINFSGSFDVEGVVEKNSLFNRPAVQSVGKNLGNIFTGLVFKVDKLGNDDFETIPENSNTRIEIGDGTVVRLEYDWDIADSVELNSGDYATIKIPDAFAPMTGGMSGNLNWKKEDGSEIVVGTYTIDPSNNQLKVVFNEELESLGNRVGKVFASLQFNESKLNEDANQTIKFEGNINKTFEVTAVPNVGDKTIKKSGTPNKTKNADFITWSIDANIKLEELTNGSVEDTIPEGLGVAYDFEIIDLKVGFDGSITENGASSITATGFPVNLGATSSAYRIKYKTKILDHSKTAYNNVATLKDGTDTKDTGEFNIGKLEIGSTIEKSGSANNGGKNSDKITWNIDVNKAQLALDGVTVEDSFTQTSGHTLNISNIRIYKIDEHGTVQGGNIASDYGSPKSFPVSLGNLENQAIRIVYDSSIDYNEYKISNIFKNEATLKVGGTQKGEPVTKTVTVGRETLIEKKGVEETSYGQPYIDWTIHVNKAKHNVNAATVTDTIGAGLKLVQNSVKIYEGTSNTEYTPASVESSSDNDFKVNFGGNISDYYTIKYRTDIIDPSKALTNEAELYGDGLTGEGIGLGIIKTGEIGPGNTVSNSYTKSKDVNTTIDNIKYDGLNHTEKTMSWKITVNAIKEQITELTIKDTFMPEKTMVFLEESLRVTKGSDILTKGTDYTLTDNKAEGFVLEFIGSHKPLERAKYEIYYKTSFDPDIVLAENGTLNTTKTYKNTATFVGKVKNVAGVETPLTAVPSENYDINQVVFDGGKKDATLDRANRTISWKVYSNPLAQDLKGSEFKITDTIGESIASSADGKSGQRFDESSLKVKTFNLSKDGTITPGVEITGYKVTYNKPDGTITTDMKEADKFEITFANGVDEPVMVEYKTIIEGISKDKYSNSANVTGKDGLNKTFSKEVTYDSHNAFISKEAISATDGKVYTDDEIKWQLKINESLSDINAGAVITDQLSDGLVYLTNSLEIKSPTETLVEGTDYTFTIANNKLTITFTNPVREIYTVTYKAAVTAGKGVKIENSANFNGESGSVTGSGDKKYTVQQFSGGTGSGVSRGSIKIVKTDAEDNSKKLKDAEFEIYYLLNGTEKQIIKNSSGGDTHKTNASGEILIKGLPLREYHIREVAAPSGYVMDDVDVTKKTLTSVAAEKDITLAFTNTKVGNAKGSIQFTKKGEGGNNLKGAEFTLYKKSDLNTAIETVTSDENGLVKFSQQVVGDYIIKETKAPEGYVLGQDIEVKIEVTENGQELKLDDVENKIIRGSIELKKEDAGGNKLPGAKFRLFDSSKNKVEDSTSDEDGKVKFEDIPYGEYTIEEIKAPTGYKASEDVIAVKIEENGIPATPSQDTVKNEKIIGDIQVIKLDEDGVTPLPGAVFVLKQGDEIRYTSDETDNKGSYVFDGVNYGEYVLEELTPPTGYNLTNEKVTVNIVEKNQDIIVIEIKNKIMRGNIKLKKVGEDGEGLENAIFSIYKSTDTEFKVPISTVKSNLDGEVLFENVAYGEYKIKETKAPTGYNLSDKVLEAKITTQDEVVDLTTNPVSNTKIRGNIEILKRNRNTHNPLKGATIGLYSVIDVLMDEKTTEDDGLIRFENLEYGRYYFRETKAPAGYILDNTKYYFDIEEDNVTLERNLDNTRRYYPPGPGPDPTYPPTGPERPTDPKPPVVPPTDPTKPVDPIEPTEPEDPVEIQEVPKEPNDPTIKEETPKDTPKEGEVEVPEGSTPKITTPPTNGTVTIDPNGKWTYTPNPGFVGKDSFTMTITHPDGTEEEIFVEIDVDEPPLGNIEVGGSTPEEPVKTLPKTGSIGRLGFYISGLLFIILGIFIVRRKTE